MTDLADLFARAEAAMADLPAVSIMAGAAAAVVDGIPCARYPIEQPWANQAKVMVPPRPAALDAALDWLDAHACAPGQWVVTTRQRYAASPVFTERGLTPSLELPVLVLGRADLLRTLPAVPGLEISAAVSAAEFLTVYGEELAPLVPAGILSDPGYHHLVGRIGGEPVACARVREVLGTAYVSAVTVVPAHRGRGVGTATSAAAARLALATNVRAVWLSATVNLHPMYTRLGFRPVGVHVQLGRG